MSIGSFFKKMQFAAKMGQTIKEPNRIVSLLKVIQKNRESLNFSFRGFPETYSSSILNIVPEQKHLLIDELYPEKGNQFLKDGRPFTLYTTCRGVPCTFKTEFIQAGSDSEGVPFFAVKLPESIRYQQRRHAIRIYIPEHHKMPVSLFAKGSAMIQGYLFDMSIEGISALFTGNLDEEIRTEGTHASLIVRINSTTNVTCPIQIVYSHYSGVKQETRIGARYVDMDRATEKNIFSLLNSLQRKLNAK